MSLLVPSSFFESDPRAVAALSRREMLRRAGMGFGAWAVVALLEEEGLLRATEASRAVLPAATARRVIFLFMQGGPSQIDTFDPKPSLARFHGEPLPESITRGLQLQFTKMNASVFASERTFQRCGESGIEIADTYPCLQRHADDLAIVRSCHHDSFAHSPAQYMVNTGFSRMGHPCLGSWVTYGLGSESADLPAFVVMTTTGSIKGGPPVHGRGFLPGSYQPTVLRGAGDPILYLDPAGTIGSSGQRRVLDLAQDLNRRHLEARRGSIVDDLSSRIASYELAFRMQSAVPEAVDLKGESRETRTLYGLDDDMAGPFATRCLIARRLIERGVRFVQIFTGGSGKDDWDRAHANNDMVHREMAQRTDRPIAGLLTDLKARGLLESTLVIWAGEFGRTPITDGRYPWRPAGRDHNPYGFTVWLAGGGVRGGKTIGATDEFGLRAVENPIHVNDLHATILRLLGLDHEKLTFLFQGREQRLTDVGGQAEFAKRLLE